MSQTRAIATAPAAAGAPGDGDGDDVVPRVGLVGDNGDGAEGERPPRVGSVKQGRKEKRKAAFQAKKAMIKENRHHERERREKAMREEGLEIPTAGKNYRDLPQEQWSVSQRINNAKRLEFKEKSTQGGYRVCIDMAFEDLMLERAQASVGQQVKKFNVDRTVRQETVFSGLKFHVVMYAYSTNRKAPQPCRITLSGMTPVMSARVHKLTGFGTWLGVDAESRCYTEIFGIENLVYLTADSPNTITHLEKGKVYIIGGLVDRNRHKGLCFKKATDQGIATAKLPLTQKDLKRAQTKVLAINHVFSILVQAMGAGGDLQKIEKSALPPRKRADWTGGHSGSPSSKLADGRRNTTEDSACVSAGNGEGRPVAPVAAISSGDVRAIPSTPPNADQTGK